MAATSRFSFLPQRGARLTLVTAIRSLRKVYGPLAEPATMLLFINNRTYQERSRYVD
jgi:hypothetical protein